VEVQRDKNIVASTLDELVELLDGFDLVDLRHGGGGGGLVKLEFKLGGGVVGGRRCEVSGVALTFGGANFWSGASGAIASFRRQAPKTRR
jgi:hypothetical protein